VQINKKVLYRWSLNANVLYPDPIDIFTNLILTGREYDGVTGVCGGAMVNFVCVVYLFLLFLCVLRFSVPIQRLIRRRLMSAWATLSSSPDGTT
jgi:hypothetical protein